MEKFKSFIDKSAEYNNSKNSNLQSHKQNDTHINVTIHAGSQALLRRPDLTKEHWNDLKIKAHRHLERRKEGHYLVYSHDHEQGFIVHNEPEKKKMSIMTVLPKGKQSPKTGTAKVIIESIDYHMTIYEVYNIY